jgi:iturin family lipopeptide synthetase A
MLSDTLTEMLQERSSLSDTGITFLEQEDKEEFLSYKGLYEAALCGMAFLQSRGVKPKDELLIQTEDNKAFLITFWACVLGGFIPVPLKVGLTEEHRQKNVQDMAIIE